MTVSQFGTAKVYLNFLLSPTFSHQHCLFSLLRVHCPSSLCGTNFVETFVLEQEHFIYNLIVAHFLALALDTFFLISSESISRTMPTSMDDV